MKYYVYSIRILFVVSIVTFFVLFFTRDIIYDIVLAIFGSSFVSLIICFVGYYTIRIDTLEDFYNSINKRLFYWTLYDINDSVEKKCDYFMNYYIKDFDDIGKAYSKIYFLFDLNNKYKNRIYRKIYQPCLKFNEIIINHYWHFKWYVDGTGKNYRAIKEFISEIEKKMMNDDGSDIVSNIKAEMDIVFTKLLNNDYL